jgi:putative ABC transport system ATP-binding protein
MIRVDGVTKLFRQGQNVIRALDSVSLKIATGEFMSVMGPSGSGKSTLLHLIGALDTPDAGEIFVEDQPLSGMSDDERTLLRRRKIGFVFQFFNLLSTLTVEENVAMPLLLDGHSMGTIGDRVSQALELVRLTERRNHRPDQLSGGQMQRVALARALVIEPVLLLADEPTGNLDRKAGEEILTFIRRTSDDRRQTVVLVTHDRRAAEYGERLVTLTDGQIVGDVAVERSVAQRGAIVGQTG